MPKRFCHAALDAAFAHVADRADRLALCAGPPADYAAAATGPDAGGVALGGVAMTLGLGQGDYAVADGAVSGRRLLVSRQEGVPIDVSGQADHVALISTAEKSLLLVTPLETPVALVAGGAVAVDAFDDEIADPV